MDPELDRTRFKKLISKANRYLSTAPEGEIVISTSHNNLQFFSKNCEGKRTYIAKHNKKLIEQLINKKYCLLIVKKLTKELEKLDKFLASYNPGILETINNSFPEEVKPLIHLIEQSNEQFAEKWADEEYDTKGIRDGERFYRTENGEKVRSKSELTIANKLFIKGIKYRYEQAHYMKGFGKVYPDFTVLNPQTREEIIWEHFGLMDNPEYVRTCLKKLQTYADNGIFPGHGLIVTYESAEVPLVTNTLDTLIKSLKL